MKNNFYKKYSVPLTAVVLFFALFSLFSAVVYAQDFSSIDTDLQTLETLLQDTINNTEEQQRLLEDLKRSLLESGNLIDSYENTITGQENLLRDLREQLNVMSETYKMQSALSQRYERNLRFWRTFTIVAIPVTALISGVVVWSVMR